MKDNEVQKKLLDLRIDNIKQERELFKHIAILASAIVGIFLFNIKTDSFLILSGIVGLFIVILISVLLLYLILQIEAKESRQAMENFSNFKKFRFWSLLNTILSSILILFSAKSYKFKDLKNEFKNITKEQDDKMKMEKDKFLVNKRIYKVFSITSHISVAIFVISILLIMIGVFY